MQYSVEDRIFVNDSGNQVKYKRLVVRGYLNGTIHEMELPISRDQATIYQLMAQSDKPEVTTHNGGHVDVERKKDENDWLNEE